ncbi:MAG: hypothetical protein JWP23_3464, partial [Phenylobacterium sp.]|nr:hypothetical protein [Phenylobacterium sp.]
MLDLKFATFTRQTLSELQIQ